MWAGRRLAEFPAEHPVPWATAGGVRGGEVPVQGPRGLRHRHLVCMVEASQTPLQYSWPVCCWGGGRGKKRKERETERRELPLCPTAQGMALVTHSGPQLGWPCQLVTNPTPDLRPAQLGEHTGNGPGVPLLSPTGRGGLQPLQGAVPADLTLCWGAKAASKVAGHFCTSPESTDGVTQSIRSGLFPTVAVS